MTDRIEQPGPRWLPLPFMPEMVQATLDGRKTQTRRVMKPQPMPDKDGFGTVVSGAPEWCEFHKGWCAQQIVRPGKTQCETVRCPYGKPGDRLWVRERQRVIEVGMLEDVRQIRVRYEADGAESGWLDYPSRLKGEPIVGKCLSYGGYRESSRLTLEVTSVRVERLRDASEEDAEAEGVKPYDGIHPSQRVPGPGFENVCLGDQPHRLPFADLWDSINAARGYSWESNPYVWVVGFRRVES